MRLEVLSKEHDRSLFDCGKMPLNEYLQKYALQNDERLNTKTFVLIPVDTNRVIVYYTTKVNTLNPASVPPEEKLRSHPQS